ncbi:UDP-N-acetylenolpyruvoylglucosamine reductase [Pedobacter ginsengisoli]|uniref:UDP-N-acetylenolpyruvoylglucosamine reductase n=1 Tax=Pedobacter ginsengisoli TaxID=363852 RepID=A0A2D1U871_9SPHI|nr:UDP-N-acetylmuramate dehydrogenase [Pedobacter ginsengisoli]ATP57813.1 UDP-N-acetylenolpyruvoylglucosamine reductase [Pedobacter ginsengisoli]
MLNVQKNKSLKPYNTFSISVDANYFAEILSEQDLLDVLKSDLMKQQSLLVLGGGSNVLFTKDFEGLVMKISIPGISSAVKGDEIVVTAGAGVVWNDLVKYCVQNGFAGIENLSLIPGTVGASPIQNIGAYGVELKDVFESCVAYEIATSEKRVFNFKDCRFGYRDSVFKNELKGQYIITSVSFKLSKSAKINSQYGAIQEELSNKGIATPTIKDISDVVSEIRVAKLPDPSTIGNAGSFFKNPVITKDEFEIVKSLHPNVVHYPAPDNKVKLAAGWLIEQCGFKGIVVGQTGTWKNQALVLVNHGSATGEEVYSFSEQIINNVDAKFGVKLEREVNIL